MASPTKTKLRVVAEDESAHQAVKLTLTEAVEGGTQRDVLVARRDAVVSKMTTCHPRDHHALDRRLEVIMLAIQNLDLAGEEDESDDAVIPDAVWTVG